MRLEGSDMGKVTGIRTLYGFRDQGSVGLQG